MSSGSSVWPILHYDDTRAALRFLVDVLGFTEVVVAHDGDEVVHAELSWPGGGALVFGSTKHRGGVHGHLPSGVNAVYVATVDPDALHDRVAHSGGVVVEPPHDTQFGSGVQARAFTAQDPEGNLWTFGTYAGPPGR